MLNSGHPACIMQGWTKIQKNMEFATRFWCLCSGGLYDLINQNILSYFSEKNLLRSTLSVKLTYNKTPNYLLKQILKRLLLSELEEEQGVLNHLKEETKRDIKNCLSTRIQYLPPPLSKSAIYARTQILSIKSFQL